MRRRRNRPTGIGRCDHASSNGLSGAGLSTSMASAGSGKAAISSATDGMVLPFIQVRCVIAAVPPGGADFFFRNRSNINLRLQPVEDRSKAEILSRNRRRAGATESVALPAHFYKQIDAAT